jgi:hypothetical protein
MIDDLVEGGCDRLGARGSTEIARVAFGMVGAEVLQALVTEALAADKFVMTMVMHRLLRGRKKSGDGKGSAGRAPRGCEHNMGGRPGEPKASLAKVGCGGGI